ncbi:P-loop containing nucleoside triphosphate hydrolase protein [Chiua virens]|nr:P-loop containing nucleoside triphosphate hydrolase protein [Chiua virens]
MYQTWWQRPTSWVEPHIDGVLHEGRQSRWSHSAGSMELYIAIVYGMLLTLLSVFGLDFGSTGQLTRHADMVFLGAFGVVAYHDLWPFFTYQEPAHQLDLYSAMEAALLGALGIVIPLTSYCEYRITDDTPLIKELHPEQTTSLLSLLLYSWLDSLISIAYKSQHLAPDALFPLADYDHVEGLVTRNASYLESRGSRGSHVFFGLVKAFSSEYAMLVFIVLVKVVVSLASPFALEQFLRYLETQGKGATIQPIVWIALLFLGPTLYSILHQWSTFVLSRMAVRTEALLSDLVFKHALRIRLQGDENCDAPPDENDSSHKANLIGTINNHLTTDLTNVIAAKELLPVVVGVPLQILLCIAFLYRILGWSALVGAAAMMCLVPVPGYVGSLFQSVEVEKMKITDARVQLVSETMNILRMIKLFGWERKINDKIQDRRAEELVLIRKRSLLQLLNNLVNFVIPLVIMLITYSVYTLVARRNLTASIVYSSMPVMDIFQIQLHIVSDSIPRFIQAKVALDRINTFLSNDDTVCELAAIDHSIPSPEDDNDATLDMIGISQATFSWTRSEPSTETPRAHSKHFTLRVHDDLVFHQGVLNLVIGPTGSGKTSLLMALLGEMHYHPSGPSSWCNLPRHLGVAYVPQESWILNQTIRDNILFGSDFDQRRYTEVLFQCALETDVALLEHGDRTEVGERGVTLSGGQKARITLARAIYSSAQVLLLDDVFAALDVQTSQWIVEHCFRGRLMMRRTIIMTTHHVSLFKDIPRYVVTLDKDGQAESHELLQASAGGDTDITDMGQDREVDVHGTPSTSDNTSTLGKYMSSTEEGKTLTTTEKIAEGHVGWPAVLLYLLGWGGAAPILNWGLFVFFLFATYTSLAAQSWYLGYWAQQYQESPTVNVRYNIAIFSLIILNTLIVYILGYTLNLVGSLRASKVIHDRLVQRILGATFRWLDTTPVARVITRCTQDIGTVDGMFAMSLSNLIGLTIRMITLLAVVVYMAPPFALFGLLTALREMSNAKAPLLAHLDAALAGLVSVRAFGAQSVFIKEYHSRIDQYTRIARTFYALNCWVSIRLEMLGALFLASLAAYLMYGYHNISPSNVGFSLNMAVDFSSAILWWITMFNETEIHGKASLTLERIASYMDVEQETERTSKTSPPAYWPASGDLRVENLSARYSSDAPNALHSLSFHIRSGERVGIVGRTGSGKTSLTLSLLRCLPAEGDVYYDGVLTSSIQLEALRSRLTIIPQSADLLNGTIRQNLDPFDQLDDAVLNDTLRSAGLSELQDLDTSGSGHDDGSNNTANRLTLDTPVTAGGANLSVGQRQIVALARAMVRESKLLILDEATSAIDHKTDAVIQRSLRELKGVTQLVIAHRLQSVMDADRIMVLDAGRIVELDSPSHLLQQEESIFRTLVYASKDRETLLSMVKRST